MRRLVGRTQPAAIFAIVLGLVIATAGTATAAKLITGKSIKDGSLTLKDFKKSEIAKLRGKQGPPGTAGVTGAPGSPGLTGQPGTPGLIGLVEVLSESVMAPANTTTGGFAKCPTGKTPISGGHFTSGPTINLVDSRAGRQDGMSGPRDGWSISMSNPIGAPGTTYKAYAICATVAGGLPPSP
jgi:hypothetical protein